MISVKKLVNNPLFTVGNVIRYGGTHMVEPESLSQHLYESAMLSLMMIKDLKRIGVDIDQGKMLERAIVHDIPESITLDFPRPVKYADMRIKEALDELEIKACKHIENLVDIPGLLDEVEICKDNTREGHLLKLVDMMLVSRKCIREVEMKSNIEFVMVLIEVFEYMDSMVNYYRINASLKGELGSEFINYLESTYASNAEAIESIVSKYNIDDDMVMRRKDIFN